jgi:hypothetical protein
LEDEAGEGQADTQTNQKTSQISTGLRVTSVERGAIQSSAESGSEKSRSKSGTGNDDDKDDRDDDEGEDVECTGEVQEQTLGKNAEGKTPPKCTDDKDSGRKGENSKTVDTGDKGTVTDVEVVTPARAVLAAKSVEVISTQKAAGDAKAKQVLHYIFRVM